jgi:hypothetical protein
MIRALAVSLAALLAGCGGNSNLQANSSGGSTGSASFPGYSRVGTLFSIVFLTGLAYESERAMSPSLHVPDLDPLRRVVELDCTKPIDDWSGNLRCR